METGLNNVRVGEVEPSSHDFADFAVRDNRIRFVALFNEIAGVPSVPMHTLQEEFVQGSLDENESSAFVEVCKGLIAATSATGKLPI